MDKRKLIGIGIIVLGFVLMAGIIYLIFIKKFGDQESTQTKNSNQTVNNTIAVDTKIVEKDIDARKLNIPKVEKTAQEVDQEALKSSAKLFAERFGSFSTQSTYQNMVDLEMFMTDSMKAWSKKYVAEKTSDPEAYKTYHGFSTKAVTAEATKYDDAAGIAIIKVGTYRVESTETMSNSKSYGQILNITYKKVNGTWKADEARWSEVGSK